MPRPHSGEPDFDGVYVEHFEFVWRCLRALGVAPGALDDAAQDVFLTVHRQLPRFRRESTLRTWLFGIVRNVAFRHRRSTRRKAARLEPLDGDLPSAGPSPFEQTADAEASAFVTHFVASLPPKRRDVFVLATLEQMSIPEVAEILSIPLNTAYTRLRAARADFQRALARQRGDHEST
jgi:RNA polymerase sigma-70 factor (ECF subfamily)